MDIDPSPQPARDEGYAWFRDGSLPHSREDRIAEVLALVALVFSLGVGIVIAMLPVSARATAAVPALVAPGPADVGIRR